MAQINGIFLVFSFHYDNYFLYKYFYENFTGIFSVKEKKANCSQLRMTAITKLHALVFYRQVKVARMAMHYIITGGTIYCMVLV